MSLLAFDIGGYSVKYGEWDKDLKHVGYFKTPDTWKELKDNMEEIFKKYENVQGIALSTPGSFDHKRGVITGMSPLDYLKGFNILEELETTFNLPITIENDANCAARAELWRGVAKDEKNALFIIIGSRINGAVVVDGKVQRGHNLSGGEFGHMILANNKSFNELVSPVRIGQRFSLFKGKEEREITGHDVFKLADKGDADALVEVEKFYDYLSLAIYNLQFTTDPSMIVIGGGISQEESMIGEVKQRIQNKLKEADLTDMEINLKTCHFLDNSNLVGAIASFSEQKGGEFWKIQ